MNHLPLIIKREYLNKVRNKSFIIMTFVTPLIGVAIFGLIAFLTSINKNKERVIDVLDESGFAKELFTDTTSTTTYNFLENIKFQEALKLVIEKEKYALLHIWSADNIEGVAEKILHCILRIHLR